MSHRTVELADNRAELSNPGMGWVLHYYDNNLIKYGTMLDPADTVDEFPGLTNLYLRLAWSAVEPREREFDWSVVDAPAQRWLDKGKRLSLRFSCSEHDMDYATPKWVRDAGAKGYNFKPGRLDPESSLWEPDFNDPVFFEKLDRFLEAAARRYDGHPSVDYIDVGSFGVWGEGHTWWSTRNHYDPQTIMRHIDLYQKHFKKTLLMAIEPWGDHGRGDRALDYAFEKGLGYRSDSILVMHGDDIYRPHRAQRFWPRRPMTLETQHYGHSVKDGVWSDGSGVIRAVEDYHATWASIHWWPREFLTECRDLIRQINLRLGYRIQPTTLTWPQSVSIDQPFVIRSTWRNAGVAPLYRGGFPTFTLKQSNGGIVAVLVDNTLNLRDLPVGRPNDLPTVPLQSTLRIPHTTRPGEYELFVSVSDEIGTPLIDMPLDQGDGRRRFKIGKIVVGENGSS